MAYLADEVGMGKTYVALGALALFRHFEPGFRVLVIAPRENIQHKWVKELRNFARNNVRFDDLRMRALDGQPVRPLKECSSLIDLVRETALDSDRDFFVRMTSFSLPLGGEDWGNVRDRLRRHLPWLRDDAFDLRNKEAFKTNFARAICCALPKFDLVIVDEAHNLKHGFSRSAAARNRVLATSLGCHSSDDPPNRRLFPNYGRRAERVLFLSATPIEESYRHLWNQLDLVDLADGFRELRDDEVSEIRKKEVASKFLVRRVTSIRIGDRDLTRNLYRREWRSGGVTDHDAPIHVTDPRQRLIVALVQKKVSEVLSGKRFNHSFQIGMLASFESFLETAKLKRELNDDATVFDNADQADDDLERAGIDVRDLNRLARRYRQTFGHEMPHPKMDAVVEGLSSSWLTGRKALVFVRRVASVTELKRKLDERYDDWLIPTIRERLPEAVRGEFDVVSARYRSERKSAIEEPESSSAEAGEGDAPEPEDRGGRDTFFAWYFRGKGPKGVVSGANIQARFIKASGAYATFFADNPVSALLGVEPRFVREELARVLGMPVEAASAAVRERAARYIRRRTKIVPRAVRFEAAQAGALELLMEREDDGELTARASVVWNERFRTSLESRPAASAPVDVVHALETETFFTELRRPERAGLRARLWPPAAASPLDSNAFRTSYREEVLRAEMLATAARLGHAFLDLYCAAMVGRTTLRLRDASEAESDEHSERDDQDAGNSGDRLLRAYFDLLEAQRTAAGPRPFGAFAELAEIADNFDLILDVNLPDARTIDLAAFPRLIAGTLRQQQPVGGMSGQVNSILVRQFRMPGYPFVLVSTELLQEGEDLHTFCSAVYHYGISWTPSAMEQRIGRVDRVRSQTDRRLPGLGREPAGDDLLQVYFPHLQDTVEVLQVGRVLERMNTFLRLMHEGFGTSSTESQRLDVAHEIIAPRRSHEAIQGPLKSAFPVPEWALRGSKSALAVGEEAGLAVRKRFAALVPLDGVQVEWEKHAAAGTHMGTATLASGRIQPFVLVLRSDRGHPLVRCISPIGRTDPENRARSIVKCAARLPSRIGAIITGDDRLYNLTLEDDVLFADASHDAARVALLVRRVTEQADLMEQEYYFDERDAALEAFDADLRKEGAHGE